MTGVLASRWFQDAAAGNLWLLAHPGRAFDGDGGALAELPVHLEPEDGHLVQRRGLSFLPICMAGPSCELN